MNYCRISSRVKV